MRAKPTSPSEKNFTKRIDYNSYNEQREHILDDLQGYTNKQLIQMIAYQVACKECPACNTCGKSGTTTSPTNCVNELYHYYKYVGR